MLNCSIESCWDYTYNEQPQVVWCCKDKEVGSETNAH